MTFLILNGFTLYEVRNLYLDEMVDFYKQTVGVLEKKGEFKEGTYDRLQGKSDAPSVINQLRRGIAKVRQKS